MHRRHVLTLALSLPLAGLTARAALAGEPPVYSNGGFAINGFDPVAYFTEEKPVAGSADFTYDWDGATWRFGSADNRDAFMANPAAFAPQYGGYCAFAVSKGYTASTDPDAWTVYEGKLYLNYSKGVRRRWSRDIPGNIAAGDANWPTVLG
jgi:YHS domain-containing protein